MTYIDLEDESTRERAARPIEAAKAESEAIGIIRALLSHGILFRMDVDAYSITITIIGVVHVRAAMNVLADLNRYNGMRYGDFVQIILSWS